MILRELKTAFIIFCLLTAVTGIVYPGIVSGVAQLVFPDKANGSLIERDGKWVGSRWLGQRFTSPRYFWSRPSATAPAPNNGAASSGSNLATTNPNLATAVRQRIAALRAADPGNTQPIPVDLITASGSGLDPHISPASAGYQIARVARARGLTESQVQALVEAHTEGRTFGLLGEPRVNVLELNLALDALGYQAK